MRAGDFPPKVTDSVKSTLVSSDKPTMTWQEQASFQRVSGYDPQKHKISYFKEGDKTSYVIQDHSGKTVGFGTVNRDRAGLLEIDYSRDHSGIDATAGFKNPSGKAGGGEYGKEKDWSGETSNSERFSKGADVGGAAKAEGTYGRIENGNAKIEPNGSGRIFSGETKVAGVGIGTEATVGTEGFKHVTSAGIAGPSVTGKATYLGEVTRTGDATCSQMSASMEGTIRSGANASTDIKANLKDGIKAKVGASLGIGAEGGFEFIPKGDVSCTPPKVEIIPLPTNAATLPGLMEKNSSNIYDEGRFQVGLNQFQDRMGSSQPASSSQIDDKSNWLRPGGDGSISDGPTSGNWGGGGFSGGQRDPTPVCRADWVPPASKMDEAFRNHDYAYMRNGLDADTPQSDPFKQEADLQLLKELREIPDSELTPQALLYKTGAELIFGKKTSGEFDPALVEKFQNIPSESLDLEQKLAQALGGTYAEGNILWGDAEKAAGAFYESVSTMAGEAADSTGKMLDDAGNYMSKQAEDASNWIDKSATELRQGFDGLFGKEPDVPGGGGGGGGETWGGGGGSFSGGGSSGSWGDGMSSGLGRGSSDKSINVMAGEAETAVGNAEAGASRAENAADRASSALNRAIDARNRLLAKVRGTSCWVARSVYGESAPEWRVFRSWLLSSAPGWLRNPYLLHGPAAAAWLNRHPVWKPPLRGVMDYLVARHRRFLEAPPAGQEGRFRRALRWLR